jgi:hypothetical protein
MSAPVRAPSWWCAESPESARRRCSTTSPSGLRTAGWCVTPGLNRDGDPLRRPAPALRAGAGWPTSPASWLCWASPPEASSSSAPTFRGRSCLPPGFSCCRSRWPERRQLSRQRGQQTATQDLLPVDALSQARPCVRSRLGEDIVVGCPRSLVPGRVGRDDDGQRWVEPENERVGSGRRGRGEPARQPQQVRVRRGTRRRWCAGARVRVLGETAQRYRWRISRPGRSTPGVGRCCDRTEAPPS